MEKQMFNDHFLIRHLQQHSELGFISATGEDDLRQLKVTDINQTAASILGVSSIAKVVDQGLLLFLKKYFNVSEKAIDKLNKTGFWEADINFRQSVKKDAQSAFLSIYLDTKHGEESGKLFCTVLLTIDNAGLSPVDHSEKLLSATARANTHLLEEKQLEEAIFKAFKVIGKATKVDRVYIFENYLDQSSQTLYCRQRMEWSRSSVTPQIDNEDLQQFPIETGIPRWYNTLKEGGVIQGLVRDFPVEEREALEPQDIISILVIPVTINDEFWGFVGFDDCSQFRSWSKSEAAILKALASNLGLRYERHRVETELEQSRTVFQQIADTIDEVFYVADASQNVLYVNSAIERVFDITQKELMTNLSSFNSRIVEHDFETIRQQMVKKTASAYEFRYNHPDGTQRNIAAKRFPVTGSDNEVERVIGVLTDVTELKRAQLEMKANLEKEHELLELKNNFISMISHEIRTPITTIISTAEMLRDFVTKMDEEKRNEMIGRVLGASKTIVSLLEDVLFIGKSDASESQSVTKQIDMEKVIIQLTDENVILKQRENRIQTSFNLTSKTVPFDAYLIKPIINNLIENASKYSEIKSKIEIEVIEENDVIHLTVTDHGIGILPEDFDKLFDPFYRSKAVADKEGTGLGLAVVKRAADALGGTIAIKSEPETGTSVTVSIPMKRAV